MSKFLALTFAVLSFPCMAQGPLPENVWMEWKYDEAVDVNLMYPETYLYWIEPNQYTSTGSVSGHIAIVYKADDIPIYPSPDDRLENSLVQQMFDLGSDDFPTYNFQSGGDERRDEIHANSTNEAYTGYDKWFPIDYGYNGNVPAGALDHFAIRMDFQYFPDGIPQGNPTVLDSTTVYTFKRPTTFSVEVWSGACLPESDEVVLRVIAKNNQQQIEDIQIDYNDGADWQPWKTLNMSNGFRLYDAYKSTNVKHAEPASYFDTANEIYRFRTRYLDANGDQVGPESTEYDVLCGGTSGGPGN